MGTMRSTWLVLALVGLQAACTGDDGTSGGVDSDGDGTADAVDCAPHSAERWRTFHGHHDVDGDGVGAGPVWPVCTGEKLPEGWVTATGDCDDGDSTRWRLVEGLYRDLDGDGSTAEGPVTGCVGNILVGYREQPGAPDCDDTDSRFQQSTLAWLDSDGDGRGSGQSKAYCLGARPPPGYAALDGDCAPDDFRRGLPLTYTYRDADADGHTVSERGTLCVVTLPAGYTTLESGLDCDDADRARWVTRDVYPDADGDGFGVGAGEARCVGTTPEPGFAWEGEDCAPEERTRWQWFTYAHRDGDGDGATTPENGVQCGGTGLPPGYHSWPNGDDCDDGNPEVLVSWSLFPDTDGDGVGAGARETLCAGTQRPEGYSFSATDCAASDSTAWQTLAYAHRDEDGDGFTVAQAGTLCAGATLPAGYATQPNGVDCDDTTRTLHTYLQVWADTDADGVGSGEPTLRCTDGTVGAPWSATGTDCEPEDGTRWRVLSYSHVDRDTDGHTTPEPGTLCTGAALPEPYFAKAAGNDCDDADASLFRWAVLYRDEDGDGVGAPPRTVPCLGQSLPVGLSFRGYDVDDADAAVQEDAEDDLMVELILAP
ncbi:hypothetical protein ACLESO_26695 [Pyxidicoccus sp. 3LG]